jgi:hypothetical protein
VSHRTQDLDERPSWKQKRRICHHGAHEYRIVAHLGARQASPDSSAFFGEILCHRRPSATTRACRFFASFDAIKEVRQLAANPFVGHPREWRKWLSAIKLGTTPTIADPDLDACSLDEHR